MSCISWVVVLRISWFVVGCLEPGIVNLMFLGRSLLKNSLTLGETFFGGLAFTLIGICHGPGILENNLVDIRIFGIGALFDCIGTTVFRVYVKILHRYRVFRDLDLKGSVIPFFKVDKWLCRFI